MSWTQDLRVKLICVIAKIMFCLDLSCKQACWAGCSSRPFTAEAPPIGKIHQFSKIAIPFEPVMPFGCPSRFRMSKNYEWITRLFVEQPLALPGSAKKLFHILFYDWKHHLQPSRHGGFVKIFSQTMTEWPTVVFSTVHTVVYRAVYSRVFSTVYTLLLVTICRKQVWVFFFRELVR